MSDSLPAPDLTAPPWKSLHVRLLERCDALAGAGQGTLARELRELVAEWWSEQEKWNAALADALRVHHEINNALVGVVGSAQLLLRGPVAHHPATRERLDVLLRESGRIEQAARRLRLLRQRLSVEMGGGGPGEIPFAA